MGEVEGSNPSSDMREMAPTQFYVAFWVAIMVVFLLVSGCLGWLLWKNYGVLVEIRDSLKK